MPVMWIAQKKWGWLSKRVIEYISQIMELEYSHLYGVATFYTMYFKKPMGKFHVQVCTNVSCMLRGGDDLYKQVCDRYGIGHLDRTNDNLISIEEVECMGACGGAPMVAINEDYHENIDSIQLNSLLDSLM
ncbi:MAG: NAD(P)H-dependent oxidoreductase subunit E [Chlorobiota bacterium]|nr:NAD(P)H-dependent oxidoreductase subunit E [Chlorobiota bacterium]QQS67875.1 MAG: NAD(P)H-dependent oxidoreductase subunit E [Chlorobiota bacterium]